MKNFCLLLVLTLAAFPLYAQVRLSGTVAGTSAQPLSFSSVVLTSSGDHPALTQSTDRSGYFAFSNLPKANYQLTIKYTGYQNFRFELRLTKDTSITIQLKSLETRLKEVVVTARTASIEATPEKVTYRIASNITASGSDVLTVIGKIPGVRVAGGEISLVGKGSVRVMVNDQLVQLSGVDLERYLKGMSANQISKIELLKNPTASYDADGNAGILKITTNRSVKPGFSGNVQASDKKWLHKPAVVDGIHNFWAGSIGSNLNYNAAKWGAYANLNVDQQHELEGFATSVFYPKLNSLQTDTGDYTMHNYSGVVGVDYKPSATMTLGLSYASGRNIYIGSDHVNNPYYSKGTAPDSSQRTFATYEPVALSNSLNAHFVVNFDTSGSKLLLNADYFNYYRTDHSDFESNSFAADGTLIQAERVRYFDNNKQAIRIYTFKADGEVPSSMGRLAFGGKLSFISNYSNAFYFDKSPTNQLSYNSLLSNEFQYSENTQSAYVELSGEKARWKYDLGLRGENTQTKGFSFTANQTNYNRYLRLFPSLVLLFHTDSVHTFSLTLGRRINRPTFWSLNPFRSLYTANSMSEGNPFLQPEYNYNLELSHSYKSKVTSALFLNLTQNGFTNITFVSPFSTQVNTFPLNFIRTYRVGASEGLTFAVAQWLECNDQFTFYHTSAQSRLPSISSVKGFGAYIATNNTIYLNAAKTLATALNFWYQFPEIDHIGHSSAYYKLDFGFTAMALKKALALSANLNDAFRSSASAVTTTVNGVITRFSNFQVNRFIMLSASYRFGKTSLQKSVTGDEEERSRAH